MSTEPVGSLTEEAAKLLAVLQGWASTTGTCLLYTSDAADE